MTPLNRILLAALVIALSMNLGNPAHAYLDAGTGSMILQLILGGTAGVLVVGKLYWARLKAFFGMAPSEAAVEDKTDERNGD